MKIVFVTFHNWVTKRHGGFHAFADYCSRNNVETVFFSFSRPYYSYFIQDERKNRQSLRQLSKGVRYGLGTNSIVNVTWPTLSIPYPYRKLLPNKVSWWFEIHSLYSFSSFADKWLNNTDCFVIESNESVLLVDRIKKKYPNSVIVYRPSDPLVGLRSRYLDIPEIKMLKKADLSILVNRDAVELYKKRIPDFESSCKYTIISNGISLSDYQISYFRPDLLKGEKTAVYIGVAPIEWQLMIDAAIAIDDVDIYIVMPVEIPEEHKEKVNSVKNLHYIPGVLSSEVPSWVTNCNVCITPMETGFEQRRANINLTAKDLKAMAAHKPIVAYSVNSSLINYGISVTYTYKDFIDQLEKALNEGRRDYSIDFRLYDWNYLCKSFLNEIRELCQQKR